MLLKYVRDVAHLVYRWFFRYPVIGGIAAILIWIVSFDGLSGIGLPDLFWRISWQKSFTAGLGVAMVFSFVVFVAFLIDSDEFAKREHDLTWYAWRTYPVLVLLLAAGFLLGHKQYWLALLLGYAGGALTLLLLHYALFRVAERIKPYVKDRRPVRKTIERATTDRNQTFHVYALLVAALLSGVYVLFGLFNPLFDLISAPLAISILLTITLFGYGWPYFRFEKQRMLVPFLVFVAIVLMNSVGRYRYRYPNISYPPRGGAVAPLVSDDGALSAWLAVQQGKPKLVVICTSGGGIRAAVWTSVMLHDLATLPGFMSRVRIITGASGGMVGAADVVAALPSLAPSQLETEDSLDDVARSLALRDVPKLVLPWAISDRGVALERRWEFLAPALKRTMLDLAPGESAGQRPSLIFTPTIVEDGRRLVISNLDLKALTSDQVNDEVGRTSLQLFELLPTVRTEMHLATAARMSASFPYVSPAAEMPIEPRRHFVDAGYWDNFGVATGTAWIRQHGDFFIKNNIDVALIQLRDLPARDDAGNWKAPSTNRLVVWFGELIAPLQGAIDVIFDGGLYRNDHLIAQLQESMPGRVTVFTFENAYDKDNSQPLSWALTKKQRDGITTALENDRVKAERGRLKTWLSN